MKDMVNLGNVILYQLGSTGKVQWGLRIREPESVSNRKKKKHQEIKIQSNLSLWQQDMSTRTN